MKRILYIGTQGRFGQLFRRELEREPELMPVGIARTAEQALYQSRFCDLALVDMPLDDEETYELVCAMRAHFPRLKILIVCEQEDEGAIMRYVEAGVAGYLLREEPVEEQMRRLRAASQDKALVSSVMAARLISHVSELEAQRGSSEELDSHHLGQLTKRENEVLRLVAQGMTNREIAQVLFIAEGTVKSHIHRILSKLNATNRHEAAAAYLWARAQERAPVPEGSGPSDGQGVVESG